MDNKHQAFWLIPRVPPLWMTKLQTFLSVSSCISGAIEKSAKIKQLQTEHTPALLHHSYQILTHKEPKFPASYKIPSSYRITWQLQIGYLDYLPFTERLTNHNNSQKKNNHPVSILPVHWSLSLVDDLSFTFLPFLKRGLLQTSQLWNPALIGWRWQSLSHSLSYRWKLHRFTGGWILSFFWISLNILTERDDLTQFYFPPPKKNLVKTQVHRELEAGQKI